MHVANRGGFSWRRLLGISSAKSRISRKIGIPLTKSGRQRKAGAAMGCSVMLILMILILIGSIALLSSFHITA